MSGPWTQHGHPIRGLTITYGGGRPPVARCGGARICQTCAQDVETEWAKYAESIRLNNAPKITPGYVVMLSGHKDTSRTLPVPDMIGPFESEKAAESYVHEQAPLWGDWYIKMLTPPESL